EKPDPRRHFGIAGAVEIDATGDLGLLGVAVDGRHPHVASPQMPRLRRRLFINFTGWLLQSPQDLIRRCACPSEPSRLHLGFPWCSRNGVWKIPARQFGTARRSSAYAKAARSWSLVTARSRWARRLSSRMPANCGGSPAVR